MDNPLRRARLAQAVSLNELAARTCLSPQILLKIDDGRFEELPGGIYARSYVRAVASALDLDPEQTVNDLIERLPPAEDLVPPAREPRFRFPVRELMQRAIRSPFSTRATSDPPAPSSEPARPTRLLAGAIDAALLLAGYALLLQLVSWSSGEPVAGGPTLARAAVAVLWTVIALAYVIVFAGIGGRTPGAWVCRFQAVGSARPLHVQAILQRAFRWTIAAGTAPPRNRSSWPDDPQHVTPL